MYMNKVTLVQRIVMSNRGWNSIMVITEIGENQVVVEKPVELVVLV